MIISEEKHISKAHQWILRSPTVEDAESLSKLREKIDSETYNLDRETGEDYLSKEDFIRIIEEDLKCPSDIFIVAEINGEIIGFSRCISRKLKRFNHQSDFGICILQEYCGYGIGRILLEKVIKLSEESGVEKISLSVIETNLNAIKLYESCGFRKEGILIKDRKINGLHYNTILMGRLKE